eukprot:IDg15533t1
MARASAIRQRHENSTHQSARAIGRSCVFIFVCVRVRVPNSHIQISQNTLPRIAATATRVCVFVFVRECARAHAHTPVARAACAAAMRTALARPRFGLVRCDFTPPVAAARRTVTAPACHPASRMLVLSTARACALHTAMRPSGTGRTRAT